MGIRRVGFVVLAIAAIVITFVAGPSVPDTPDADRFSRQIEQALDDYESNDALTSGAPQQQVVNGWIARDLLTVIAEQNTAQLEVAAPAATDNRVPLLLMVLVLAVCWHAATVPTALAVRPTSQEPVPVGPTGGSTSAGETDTSGMSPTHSPPRSDTSDGTSSGL